MPADPTGAGPHGRRANRLGAESSPYLLQHAYNPVDWWPWGDAAFAEARRRDVPIFLSIGYSTCYWCHVMERESFEDEAIARRLNEHFVCVKVDREQRPDVDDLHMTAVQIMTGRGGWPMSVFLEPASLRPFWCGTYFPPEPRMNMPGMPQVIESIAHAWKDRRAEVMEQATLVGEAVGEQVGRPPARVAVGLEQVTGAASTLLRMFDRTDGGFGGAPKFPQPVFLEFLVSVRAAAGDEATRAAADEAIRLTLDRMAVGGVRDQISGGFHRYSVDATWTVPHFEKMLYDNAQLAGVYARAAEAYGDDWYRRIAREVLDEMLRDFQSPDGGFYSALDAEVDGREGLNYLWTAAEVRGVLTDADADFAIAVFGLNRPPNFRDPHHPNAPPSSVLRLNDRPERVAAKVGVPIGEFWARFEGIQAALLAARAKRPGPSMDDKVLAGWNGLMMEALVRGAVALSEPRYMDAARRAASFILGSMRTAEGNLLRVWRAGKAQTPAFLEDYAMLLRGLLALARHDTDGSTWLRDATSLAAHAAEFFADGDGGYFDAPADTELFVRLRSTHDGAIPGAGSVMLHNLLDLYDLSAEDAWLDRAVACLGSLSGAIAASPVASINATRGLLRVLALGEPGSRRLAAFGASAPTPAPAESSFTPVEVYADAERIEVGPDRPAQVRLAVHIAPGHHINAADPGERSMGLIPLRVGVVRGTGIAAYADYPAGEAFGDGVLVHRGRVEFPVAVELSGEWTGNPMLAVTFQACTDTECLAPTTVELDVAVDRVT